MTLPSLIKRLFGRRHLSETDLERVDSSLLDDPTMSAQDKMTAAFLQFHRSSMRERHEDMTWKRRRNIALIVFAVAGTVTSIVYNAERIAKSMVPVDTAGVVNIVGGIGDSPAARYGPINEALKQAFENPRVKRVILRINSPGGLPSDAESIVKEIARLKAKHPKPVDAVIETMGASAAYMIAVHADTLYAGRYSLVGSIGAIIDGWNFSSIMEKVDAKRMTYVSGPYKDMMNPYRPVREDERAKVQAMVNRMGGVFADEVLQARKGKIKLRRNELATGEVWLGVDAAAFGLVDKLATVTEVANAHGLEARDMGPHEPGGIFIPIASSLSEKIGSAFSRGLMSANRSAITP